MPMRRLPCDDPKLAAIRAGARERMARMAARKRASAQPQPIRIRGSVIFEPVTCPKCGAVSGGVRPLLAYALHRSEHCPWRDAEKEAHDKLVTARRNKLASEHARRVYHPRPRAPKPPKETGRGIPPLHTGHELFERARAVRRYWPKSEGTVVYPIWEDLLSEGVLALLEERDPAEAMRQFMHDQGPQMLSLDAPLGESSTLTLLDVLAA